jgi:hypothetical protein
MAEDTNINPNPPSRAAAGSGFPSVIAERERQDRKWGVQIHPPAIWLVILGEEVGEACKATLLSVGDRRCS